MTRPASATKFFTYNPPQLRPLDRLLVFAARELARRRQARRRLASDRELRALSAWLRADIGLPPLPVVDRLT